ncbi:MAG: sigma 54-interacting transcriptional regulator [Planctomycetes bacterium]|nr:sigma 54-interacting transcriptional regulator [Planctomycetota bacterium]
MPTLEVVDGPGKGKVFPVTGDVVIGREGTCGVRLDDGLVSRAHVNIRKDGPDLYSVRDRGSSNGTIVNGRKIEGWEKLRDGDEIALGQTVLAFHLRGAVSGSPSRDEISEPETIIQKMQTQDLSILNNKMASSSGGEHVNALRFLLDLARAAEEADRPETLAQVLADGIAPTIYADRVFLFAGRDENMRPVERKLSKVLARIYAQPYSTTVVKQAARERVAIMSCLPEDERFKSAQSVATGEITSAICVPLIVGEELLGALYLDRLGEADPFTSTELELSTAAGLQCSMALLNIRRLQELRATRDRLEVELTGPSGFIGDSKVLRPVYDFINRVAPTDAGVLILGESGTGKELIARAIHKASPRVDRPFVIVNCAALAESLAEAELFGHERGAFTGADKSRPGRFLAADGGSIFLDEVGELSEPIQAKLLRVLEEGEIAPVGEAGVRHIDVRVIAATNRDLVAEVEAGRFRRDLYYRLNILSVELPPLRLRSEDIRLLIEHFLKFFGERCNRPALKLSPKAEELCMRYQWPGNVRELRNAVERMVIMAQGESVDVGDLPPELGGRQTLAVPGGVGGMRPLADVERDHIMAVLDQVDGNKKRAAEVLQIDRSTLYAKLKQYGVDGV